MVVADVRLFDFAGVEPIPIGISVQPGRMSRRIAVNDQIGVSVE